jgi:hypothetical protein
MSTYPDPFARVILTSGWVLGLHNAHTGGHVQLFLSLQSQYRNLKEALPQ